MRSKTQSKLYDRRSRGDWIEITNGASMRERAYGAAIDIIQNHRPYTLTEGVPEAMDEIVKEFEKELGIAKN